ncbi:MAG: hypothetical protein IKC48_03720 [Clostridia bacterium]|nr:hypothetical protein [Clostridia bacterium]
MEMQYKQIEKNKASDLVLLSVGACPALPKAKRQPHGLIIAYISEPSGKPSFLFVGLPKKGLYGRQDILDFIKEAENVKHVTYMDDKGRDKDIRLCRNDSGTIIDVAPRNEDANSFVDGFAEVTAAPLRFVADMDEGTVLKEEKPFTVDISYASECKHRDGYCYAIVNAYNAAVLGLVFDRDELQLETREGKRVRIEVRNANIAVVEENVMYVAPITASEGVIDYYLTEEFNYIDGNEASTRKYKISYSSRLSAYRIIRE